MQSEISFSALLSVYKNDVASTLDICLDSLFNQTEPLDEIIVVQEGEVKPELTACLTKWQQKFGERFAWYQLPFQNGPMGFGLPSCLNYGIEHAKSTHIFRVDTDDINLPNRVKIQKEFALQNPEIKLFGAFIQEFSEDMQYAAGVRDVPVTHEEITKKAVWRNPFNGPAVVFEKATALQLGSFPIVPSNEDYCFWANFILKGYKTANIPQILVHMRAGDGLLQRRSSKRYRLGEMASLKYLHQTGFFSTPMYWFHCTFKFIVRKMPASFIKQFYNKLLRS